MFHLKENSRETKRSTLIDLIKMLAIIAVVFYHLGYFKYGYLGVDVFFIINGFLVVNSINKSISNDSFSYISFIIKKIFRLLPLLLFTIGVCMFLGFYLMLPDDYENLAESAVATIFFANNILACITTGNYWDVVNEFKPLMHTWYLGVLMQGYLIIPLIPMIVKKCKGGHRNLVSGIVFLIFGMASFALYLSPSISFPEKFYYLPYRFWEMAVGAALACFLEGKIVFKQSNSLILKLGASIGGGYFKHLYLASNYSCIYQIFNKNRFCFN